MNSTSVQLSLAIDSVARAIAEWSVTRLFEVRPDLTAVGGERARSHWVGELQLRVGFLAQAVAVRRPQLFSNAVLWSGVALSARGLSREILLAELQCLREVIQEHLPAEAAARATECLDASIDALEHPMVPPSHVTVEHPHGRLAARYLEGILDGRDHDARMLILDAAAAGTPVPDLYEHVLQPAQAELGSMWLLGEITVAEEHRATASTQMLLTLLRAHFPVVTTTGHRVVAASIGGDLHDLGLRMATDFFEMAGWVPLFLGANVPAGDVIDEVCHRRPDLLAISASSSLHVRGVGELISRLRSRDEGRDVTVIVGGQPFNEIDDLWREVGADGHVRCASEAPALAARLIAGRR